MSHNKILVTGGAGYIGSHTCIALASQQYEPIIVDNFINSEPFIIERMAELTGKAVTFYNIDVGDKSALDEVLDSHKDISGVIHFAAFKAVGESVADPLKYYHNNLGSLVTLLAAMEERGIANLVFSSSCTVYGEPDALPVTEQSPIKPAASPYGYTKQVSERIITDTQAASGMLQAVLLRYFNPIGAHPSGRIGELPIGTPNNLVPFVTQTAAGIRKNLTIFGNDYPTPDGTCIRDYIHVMDLAEAHVKALDWLYRHTEMPIATFNIGTGEGYSVQEVVDTFEATTGITCPYTYGPRRPGDVTSVYADATLAKHALKWEAKRKLSDALADAWRWQQSLK